MNKKKAIKRFLLTLMWLGVAGGMGVIITAAIRVQEAGVCKGYQIKIDGFNPNELFTSEEHIVSLLKAATKGDIQGQKKSDINLPVIEGPDARRGRRRGRLRRGVPIPVRQLLLLFS